MTNKKNTIITMKLQQVSVTLTRNGKRYRLTGAKLVKKEKPVNVKPAHAFKDEWKGNDLTLKGASVVNGYVVASDNPCDVVRVAYDWLIDFAKANTVTVLRAIERKTSNPVARELLQGLRPYDFDEMVSSATLGGWDAYQQSKGFYEMLRASMAGASSYLQSLRRGEERVKLYIDGPDGIQLADVQALALLSSDERGQVDKSAYNDTLQALSDIPFSEMERTAIFLKIKGYSLQGIADKMRKKKGNVTTFLKRAQFKAIKFYATSEDPDKVYYLKRFVKRLTAIVWAYEYDLKNVDVMHQKGLISEEERAKKVIDIMTKQKESANLLEYIESLLIKCEL